MLKSMHKSHKTNSNWEAQFTIKMVKSGKVLVFSSEQFICHLQWSRSPDV